MKILSLLALTFAISALGHRENQPGPHGGVIRMPGSFHTELVVIGGTAKIWLLDGNFKNPTTKNSTLSVKVANTEVHCVNNKDHFECHLTREQQKAGELKVRAARSGLSGKEVTYPLATTSFERTDDHSHH